MQATGSVSKGPHCASHNRRDHDKIPNVDKSLTPNNVVIYDEDLGVLYERTFGAARRAYNETQVAKGHSERQIPDYLAKVEADAKKQPVYEFVVQCGNHDDHPPADVCVAVYKAWTAAVQKKLGKNFVLAQAIVHLDEPKGAPHAHVAVIPVATAKRGLSLQNSMTKALEQAGYKGANGWNMMMTDLQTMLTECMEAHGLERIEGDKAKQRGGININAYKRLRDAEEQAEELEKRAEVMKEGVRRAEEAAIGSPIKIASELARFGSERRDANEQVRELRDREKALRSEISGLEERIRAAEREVGRLHDACGRAGRVIDRVLAAAGELRLRASAAWRDSALGRAVLDILNSRRCPYELGTVTGYVPGGLELREVDGQLQRLREAARRQREQRQPDIQRGRSTTQAR